MNAPITTPPQPVVPITCPNTRFADLERIAEVLRSGWLTTGAQTDELERRIGARLGPAAHCVALASCTAALRLALRAREIGPGDEVITSTWTFSATAEAIASVGARPVLVDVEPDTLNLDPAAAAAAITPRTKALLPVHFAGLPVDLDAFIALADAHGLALIEDAAHAFGAAWRGVPIGAVPGSIACFSFHATKNLACGEGGMLATDDPAAAAAVRRWSLHGHVVGLDPERPWLYDIVDSGDKCNLSDVHAAIGLEQLDRFDAAQERRRAIAERYRAALAGLPVRLPPRGPAHVTHGLHLFPIRCAPRHPWTGTPCGARSSTGESGATCTSGPCTATPGGVARWLSSPRRSRSRSGPPIASSSTWCRRSSLPSGVILGSSPMVSVPPGVPRIVRSFHSVNGAPWRPTRT